MLKWVKENNIKKSNFVVDEHINFYTDINFFSIYDGGEINLFFERFELDQEKNKFVCYDIKRNDIKIIINNEIVYDNIIEKTVLNTNLYTSEINKIEIEIDGSIHDCTDSYNKIGRSKIFYL